MEYRINLTDDTAEKLGRAMGAPIQELEQEILEKEQEIKELQDEIAEFPEIEQLSVTENGTYSEEGKAYDEVTVNVPQTTVEALTVTENGTYSEAGKAYSPVTVNVAGAKQVTISTTYVNNTNSDISIIVPDNAGTSGYDDVLFKEIVVSANSTLQNQTMHIMHRSVGGIFVRPIVKDADGNSVSVQKFTISNVSQYNNPNIASGVTDNKIKFTNLGNNFGTIVCTLTINSLT